MRCSDGYIPLTPTSKARKMQQAEEKERLEQLRKGAAKRIAVKNEQEARKYV